MTQELDPNASGPGEARAKKRQRTQFLFIAVAGAIGGVIGFSTGFFDEGNGNLFSGDWEALKLPTTLSVLLAIALFGSLVALPLYGFTMIDDFKREQNFVAFTGSALSVLAAFPIWAVLHAGGLVGAPHAFGVWAVGFVSMFVAFGYAMWGR